MKDSGKTPKRMAEVGRHTAMGITMRVSGVIIAKTEKGHGI